GLGVRGRPDVRGPARGDGPVPPGPAGPGWWLEPGRTERHVEARCGRGAARGRLRHGAGGLRPAPGGRGGGPARGPPRRRAGRGGGGVGRRQRASGRWFTPASVVGPAEGGVGTRDLYVQNLGTAFAVLALEACERTDSHVGPVRRLPGLALRDRLISD